MYRLPLARFRRFMHAHARTRVEQWPRDSGDERPPLINAYQ